MTVATSQPVSGPPGSSALSWPPPNLTGCTPSTASRPIPEHDAANCSTSAGRPSTWTRPRSPLADQRPSCEASESKEPPRAAGPGSSASTARPSPSCASISVIRTKNGWLPGSAWTDSGGLVFTSRWGEPLYPDTVTALMSKLIREHNKSVSAPGETLPHARLHDLRHLHATTLLLAGVPSTRRGGTAGSR